MKVLCEIIRTLKYIICNKTRNTLHIEQYLSKVVICHVFFIFLIIYTSFSTSRLTPQTHMILVLFLLSIPFLKIFFLCSTLNWLMSAHYFRLSYRYEV